VLQNYEYVDKTVVGNIQHASESHYFNIE